MQIYRRVSYPRVCKDIQEGGDGSLLDLVALSGELLEQRQLDGVLQVT